MPHSYEKARYPRRYWASSDIPEELASEMLRRCRAFYDYLESIGRISVWKRSEGLYYGEDPDSGASSQNVRSGGETGETLTIHANHFRSLVSHSLTLATGTRPAIVAKADNSDYRTASNRRLAESIFQHHIARGDLEDALVRAAEYAHTHGEGYVVQLWDDLSGEMVDVVPQATAASMPTLERYQAELAAHDEQMAQFQAEQAVNVDPITGQPAANDNALPPAPPAVPEIEVEERGVYDGDVLCFSPHPSDVVRDIHAHAEKPKFYILRRRELRWSLAAKFPASERLILEAGDCGPYDTTGIDSADEADEIDDYVYTYTLFHDRTPFLPRGKTCVMVGGQVIPESIAELGYRYLPVHPMIPTFEGTRPVGYGMGFDLVSLSKAFDAGLSTVLTNYDALATANIYVPDGGELDVQSKGGVRVFHGPQKPESLDLMKGISNSEEFLALFQNQMELISGINSVARGEPDQLKAGVALAFMQAMAIQATSNIQRAYARLIEGVGTALIHIYRVKATGKRVVEIAGVKHASKIQEFVGADLEGVNTISVDISNPMMRSLAWRIDVAEKLLSHPTQPITPKQFLSVQATGQLDDINERPEQVSALIELENERLRSGEGPVLALPTDDAREHVTKHLMILDDPEARLDPELVYRVMAHVNEHKMHAAQVQATDPILLELAGIQPLATVPIGGMPMMGPQGAPPANDNAAPSAQGGGPAPEPAAAQRPGMPGLPPNAQVPPDVAAQSQAAGMPTM